MTVFQPTKKQLEIQNQIIEFGQKELNSEIQMNDRLYRFNVEGWKKCGELKLQGLAIPEKWGGKGYDAMTTILALEGLGYGCEDNGLNFSICAHLLACAIPIWQYGNEFQRKKFLPGLCGGQLIATNGMTEPESGSDAYSLNTIAIKDSTHYSLNGIKSFCANAPIADIVVTYALTNREKGFYGGITAFILEKELHHYSVVKISKMGLRTCQTGKIEFNNTKVESENILGESGGGGFIFSKSMEWERICLGAIHLGCMQRLLEKTIEFVKKRKSSGLPIGKYQAISHQLADLKVNLENAKLLTYQAAWNLDNNKNTLYTASATKLYVSETYKDMSIKLMQIFGGQAYLDGHAIERNLRDAISCTIYSGTSEIQRNIIARSLGL